LLFGLSCVDQRHDELYAESTELRQHANMFTNALSVPDAVLVPGPLPELDADAPHLESVFNPMVVVQDESPVKIQFKLVHPVADAERIRHVLLHVEKADKHLKIPVNANAQTGQVLLELTVLGTLDLAGRVAAVNLATVDLEGRCSNSIVVVVRVAKLPQGVQPANSLVYHVLDDHQGATRALDLARVDGTSLLASGGHDNEIALWDLETGHQLRRFLGHTGWVLSVDLTRNGKLLASGSRDNTVRLWDTQSGEMIVTWGNHLDDVTSVALSHNDILLASGSWDQSVHVRDLTKQGELVGVLDAAERVNAVAYSNNGEYFALGAGRLLHPGRVMVWNTSDWTVALDFPDLDREVTAIAFSSKAIPGKLLSFDPRVLAAASGRGAIYVWKYDTGELIATMGSESTAIGHKLPPPKDTLPSIDFWPGNNNVLAAVSLTGVIALWKISESTIVGGSPTATALTTVRFAANDFRLMLGGQAGLTHLLGVESLAPTN
jgi:WD40 repeat protein